MWIAEQWQDYELLDCGGGEKLERWGEQYLVRPDPQAIWDSPRKNPAWKRANARYLRSQSGGGHWEKKTLPESWKIRYRDLTFQVKPMNFKHTGLFPEQAVNWDFAMEKIRNAGRPIRVLNLFAYTGGATVACAKAGASVCHVDAAKGMVAWARENARLSGLGEAPIRWIVDDCGKFVEREIRRGKTYDAIIMDPPSYGRGPGGEVWKLEDNLYDFVKLCAGVLSERPLFVLINSYTTGLAPSVLGYLLHLLVGAKYGGKCTWDELGLPVTETGLALPCGAASEAVGRTAAYLLTLAAGAVPALALFGCLSPRRRRHLAAAGLASPVVREAGMALFWMFCGGMALVTLTPRWVVQALADLLQGCGWNGEGNPFFAPGTVNLVPFRTLGDGYILAGNLIMFLPFGFFPALLWRGCTWKRALAAGLCVTGFIECWQLLVGRAFDIDDLWLNTLGAFCGFWSWCLLDRAAPGWTRRFRVRQIQD